MAPEPIDEATQKYIKRFEEGYDVYDQEYYEWMKHNHPVEAATWIKSVIRTEDASDAAEKPTSSTGNTISTNQASELETSCENLDLQSHQNN